MEDAAALGGLRRGERCEESEENNLACSASFRAVRALVRFTCAPGGEGVARVWRGCGAGVARVWQECGAGVARV